MIDNQLRRVLQHNVLTLGLVAGKKQENPQRGQKAKGMLAASGHLSVFGRTPLLCPLPKFRRLLFFG